MKNVVLTLFCCLVVIMGNAQLGPPSTPTTAGFLPPLFSPPTNVTHTGNSSCWYNFEELRVSVWDGAEASFNWNYNGLQGTVRLQGVDFGHVNDPDIVVTPGPGFPFLARIMIFYEIDNEIYGEAWGFDGTICTPFFIPEVMSGDGCYSRNPNIDVLPGCGLALIWEECRQIRARYFGFGGPVPCDFGIHPIVDVSACFPMWHGNWEPDISLSDNGVEQMVNFTYITADGPTERLILQQQTLLDFSAGNAVVCDPMNTIQLDMVPAVSESLNFPRIASPPVGDPSFDIRDCQVVVARKTTASEEILGYNTMTGYAPTSMNDAPDIRTCGRNVLPVVSYTDCNRIMVEWEYSGACLYGGVIGPHIIARKLMSDGTPIPFGDYTAVTWDLTGSNRYPSVCGRYLLGSPTNVTSLFHQESAPTMRYTFSSCGGPLAKTEPEALSSNAALEDPSTSVFPNPFVDQVTVQFYSTEQNPVHTVEVLDMQGRVVMNWTSSHITDGLNQLQWNVEELPAGSYLVRIQGNESTTNLKVQHLD